MAVTRDVPVHLAFGVFEGGVSFSAEFVTGTRRCAEGDRGVFALCARAWGSEARLRGAALPLTLAESRGLGFPEETQGEEPRESHGSCRAPRPRARPPPAVPKDRSDVTKRKDLEGADGGAALHAAFLLSAF